MRTRLCFLTFILLVTSGLFAGDANQSPDYNRLAEITNWYSSYGAPAPILKVGDITTYPTGFYVWDHVVFTAGTKTVDMGISNVMAGPEIGLIDLAKAGLVKGVDVYNPPKFISQANQPPPPVKPVDSLVGLLDSARKGPAGEAQYGPTDAARALIMGLAPIYTDFNPYLSPTGRKFKVVVINPGSMFAVANWQEVK